MENFIPRSYIDPKNFEELSNLILQLHQSRSNQNGTIEPFKNSADIIKVLNKIFPDKNCTGFTFTENIDKPFFGIYVNLTITNNDLI